LRRRRRTRPPTHKLPLVSSSIDILSVCVCARTRILPPFCRLSTLDRCLTNHLSVGEEEEFITNWEETVENFDDMGLKEGVLRGIYGYGFVKPSPIQQKGILPVIQGKDTIAQVINILNNNSKFIRPNLEPERQAASQFQFCSWSTPHRCTPRPSLSPPLES